eukprot:TRINITY_DN7210_c0_g1_i2.p1 TRINITY_DN7210_c0_g1~~TRINITY_DN7210_c0_g1_i2.p1  ORF type:complete len:327 (+),score=59.05 TRINITY_DN7210_c0_g1_i2:51-1031(+)
MCLLTVFSLSIFFFFNDTATTEIYTRSIVGSVRCVQETGINAEYMGMKDEERNLKEEQKNQRWKQWKQKRESLWVKNHTNRVKKFVVDMQENKKDYSHVYKEPHNNGSATRRNEDSCLGPQYFIFRPFKSERERVLEKLEQNEHLRVPPLSIPTQQYEFRVRDRSREIQPEMKFTSSIKNSAEKSSMLNSVSNSASLMGIDRSSPKLHFKSAHSLLLDLGVMHDKKPVDWESEDNPIQQYNLLVGKKEKKDSKISQKVLGNLAHISQKDVAVLLKRSKDPIQSAARFALEGCNYIQPPKNFMYRGVGRRDGVLIEDSLDLHQLVFS